MQLVSGKNNEGYLHALFKTWDLFSDLKSMPVKSALTKARGRVSFLFFKDHFDELIKSFEPHRRTWRGLRVYATDGDQHELPRSKDVLAHDYRGFPFCKERETHYPRMFAVNCYDVLSGVTKAYRYSNNHDEMKLGNEIAKELESNSITLYDRLYFNRDLIRAHQHSGSYFVARCKNHACMTEVRAFFDSSLRNHVYEMEGVLVQLVKVINPKTKEPTVFATNLPRTKFKNKELADLYALRWEVETSNRDLTETLKMEQWHSLSMNGILQELYATLWMMNQTRIQMAKKMQKRCNLKSLFDYKKSNFKLIFDFILDSLSDLVRRKTMRVQRRLDELLSISVEHRKRRTRSNPRHIRRALNQYPVSPKPERRPK